ncbi:kinase-like protein [Hysterangium stoloniferum]|nr:kinase-like protein [Hysterangium stoloniferum]
MSLRATYSTSTSLLSATLNSAYFVAQFTPIPALQPALGAVIGIIDICQQIVSNRKEALQLQERCKHLILALNDPSYQAREGSNFARIVEGSTALSATHSHLQEVLRVISSYADLSRWNQVLRHAKLSEDIVRCHQKLDACCTEFQIRCNMQLLQWYNENETSRKEDQVEVLQALKELGEGQTQLREMLSDLSSTNQSQISSLMQIIQDFLAKDSQVYSELERSLHAVQRGSGRLPPAIALEAKEGRRVGSHPVGGNAAFDIWEGVWLKREKVALKTIRSIDVSPDTINRFTRQAEIWKKIWERDQGHYIVPFYGVGYDDGPYPYIVSPWMNNGTVNEYLAKYPRVNRRDIIKGIAEGLRLLHNLQPNAVAHGDIRGANIMINDIGQPMLADFGLSKILEDVTGVPFTQSKGVSESFRWFAPEMCQSPGIISTHTDVFAFAMTIIEIYTGSPPYDHIRMPTEVLIKMPGGERPKRPSGSAFSDNMWKVTTACWAHKLEERPKIDWVLENI